MASQYFYQKQMGPRRTPPPRKTSLIEINGAVPDISMLSDCLGNVRVDTNGENYSEFNHRSKTRFEDANTYLEQGQQQSSSENFLLDKEILQSKKIFDDSTKRRSPPTTYGDSKHIYDDFDNFGNMDQGQESPVQNDPDFDRECIDSYQKWRAKNAVLFATPETAAHNVPDQTISHKVIGSQHNAVDFKSVQLNDHFQSPEKSALDKYYEYFKRDQNPCNKQYDTGDLTNRRDVAVYSEKIVPHNTSPHQIISNREARYRYTPKFRISDELESNKYHEYQPKSKAVPCRHQYQRGDLIHEKGYMHAEKMRHVYDPCCDSPRCKQERFRLDEEYKTHLVDGNALLRRRYFEEEEEERIRNNRVHEDFNRPKKDGCSKNSVTRKKLKKSSPVLKTKGVNKKHCSCPECDDVDENDEESHCDLVKYKTSKNSSQRCRKEIDESDDSSLDCFSKRSCKNSRKRNTVSFEDLCRFVKLQNEQILLIQKQVDKIGQKVDVIAQKVVKLELQNKSPVSTKNSDRRKSVDNSEKCGCNCENKEKNKAQSFKLSVVKENSQIECLQAVDNHNGVSIGVMTSCVEIMQKAQIEQKNVRQKKNNDREDYSDNHEQTNSRSKITGDKRKRKKKHSKEPTRSPTENRKHPREVSIVSDSFNLNEGELQVFREPTPSPEPSIHIDIEDFSSSSSSSGASSDDESEPNAHCNSWDTNTDSDDVKMGWTLYNNIVGQVNNILQNPPPSSDNQKQMAVPSPEDVRKATLEQLRLLGVNLGEVDNTMSKKVTFNQQLYPREEIPKEDNDPVSHLNALAKMYLQQEQFHEGTSRKELPDNIRNGNTNLSHATLCYLEKYKIKPGSANREKRFDAADNGPIVTDIPKPQPRRLHHHHNKNHHHHNQPQHQQNHYPTSRILDITELKQQPKLL